MAKTRENLISKQMLCVKITTVVTDTFILNFRQSMPILYFSKISMIYFADD